MISALKILNFGEDSLTAGNALTISEGKSNVELPTLTLQKINFNWKLYKVL